jgi:hypothetical protein
MTVTSVATEYRLGGSSGKANTVEGSSRARNRTRCRCGPDRKTCLFRSRIAIHPDAKPARVIGLNMMLLPIIPTRQYPISLSARSICVEARAQLKLATGPVLGKVRPLRCSVSRRAPCDENRYVPRFLSPQARWLMRRREHVASTGAAARTFAAFAQISARHCATTRSCYVHPTQYSRVSRIADPRWVTWRLWAYPWAADHFCRQR